MPRGKHWVKRRVTRGQLGGHRTIDAARAPRKRHLISLRQPYQAHVVTLEEQVSKLGFGDVVR